MDLPTLAALDTAVRWAVHSWRAARWLRLHSKEMTHDQRLAYSRDVARGAESRDKALARLGIRYSTPAAGDQWEEFYNSPTPDATEPGAQP